MGVAAIKEYTFDSADRVENFHGNQLLYVGWEDHLMFCAPFAFPFPPDTPFQAVIDNALPAAFGYHPDFARIDWTKVEWFKSGQPWQPQFDKSLAEIGLGHKAVVRFRTPGLAGIEGSCS